MPKSNRLYIYQSDEFIEKITQRIVQTIQKTIAEKNHFYIALSGGSTPQPIYSALAKLDLPWDKISFFFSDERAVSINNVESNYYQATMHLFNYVPDNTKIYPMFSQNIQEDAKKYSKLIQEKVPLNQQGIPQFDLILLGIGEDGHIASLFPSTSDITTNKSLIQVTESPKPPHARLSMSCFLIQHAHLVYMIVKEAAKKEIVKKSFDPSEKFIPVHCLMHCPRLEWHIEQSAAVLLDNNVWRS